MRFHPSPDGFTNANDRPITKPEDISIHWRPTAYAALRSPDHPGCILMVSAHDTSFPWQFPGGGVNVQENLLDGLHREVLEETGFDISKLNLELTSSGERRFYWTSQDSFYHSLYFIFSGSLPAGAKPVQAMNGDPEHPDEITKLEWVPMDTIDLDDVHPLHRKFVAEIKNNE